MQEVSFGIKMNDHRYGLVIQIYYNAFQGKAPSPT